jgi:hypothetical protein
MLQIDNCLISDDIFLEQFECELTQCKGKCCIEGDLGAPLEYHELKILEQIFEKIKPFLRKIGIQAIEKQGKYVEHAPLEFSTPLVDGKECAYLNFENGIAVCGIEKAWHAGVIDFPKPISCHLYPIRIWEKNGVTALNYEEWDICQCACSKGKRNNKPVYQFLKDAIIRRFGNEFYEILDAYYHEEILGQPKSNNQKI